MEGIPRIQLHQVHERTARLTSFAGFEMPLYYNGITTEHLAVRQKVGIFDISHMGRVMIAGVDSEHFLNHVITNDVSRLPPNSAQYSVMCTEKGGIVDDFIVYRLEPEKFMIVSNAINRKKDNAWLIQNADAFKVKIEEVSDSVAMLAVQGPNAARALQKICEEDLGKVERFKCSEAHLANVGVFLARTGYTGEDGFEIFVWNTSSKKPDFAIRLWEAILEAGKPFGIEPCGLGARDTLRLEAGLCLYGSDIDENTSPLEAGLSFVVKLQKDEFIGKVALLKQKDKGVKHKRVGIKMTERGIPRPSFDIYGGKNERIGYLTSGTYSPLLKCGIGMGYIDVFHVLEGTTVGVRIRNRLVKGQIAAFPLYDVEKYGYRKKTLSQE